MARPRSNSPTPAELEVLKVLWDRGDLTVREVMEVLNRRQKRAYTSVMSLLNVMAEKGLLVRKPRGRAFTYAARADREKTRKTILGDLLSRVFEGSASTLVAQLLEETKPSPEELDRIHGLIESYEEQEERRR